MKAILCMLVVALSAVVLVAAAVKSHAADDLDAVPVKVLLRCGSLVGAGEILVSFDGEVSAFKVMCGGKSV